MDPDGGIPLYILILLALIGLSAFFNMSETAIVSLNDGKIRKMAQEGHKSAKKIVALIDRPSRFLAFIQVGVTVSGFLAAALAAMVFAQPAARRLVGALPTVSAAALEGLALVLVTLLLAFLSLVFGSLVPRRVGMQHFERIALAVAGPVSFAAKLEKPFVWLLNGASGLLFRLLGIDPDSLPEQVTEEEIRLLIDVGKESGSIEEQDKEMLNNIFEFDDRTAVEMMTHRTEVEAMEADANLEEIVQVALESGYSRIPVYEGDLDCIVGILYVKDLLDRLTAEPGAEFSLAQYIREPLYVLESTSGKMLLSQFKARKLQMAVVVDEYGGTSGIVTMEDILESIVGNIQDEYDHEDEDEDITPGADNCYTVDGLADLDEVAKFFSLAMEEEDLEESDTIGGYIVHRLGYLPVDGERPEVLVGDVRFTVEGMEERRIAKLKAEILRPAADAKAADSR